MAIVISIAMVGVGCDDGRPALYSAGGAVVFADGDPVRNATIEFVPEVPGPSPRALVDSEGRFTLGTYAADDGAPAGDYRVVVAQVLPPGAERAAVASGDEHLRAGKINVVALKHASPDSTGILETVRAQDANVFEITVEAR